MDERYGQQPLARWYLVAAIASALFMAAGIADFIIGPRS